MLLDSLVDETAFLSSYFHYNKLFNPKLPHSCLATILSCLQSRACVRFNPFQSVWGRNNQFKRKVVINAFKLDTMSYTKNWLKSFLGRKISSCTNLMITSNPCFETPNQNSVKSWNKTDSSVELFELFSISL